MSGDDRIKVSKTMAFLLRHRPDIGGLALDADGWATLDDVARGVEKLLRREVPVSQLTEVADDPPRRFEIAGERIRARRAPPKPPPPVRKRTSMGERVVTPDILHHATTEEYVRRAVETGSLVPPDSRPLFLSAEEGQAWRVAHRLHGEPRVLYIDTARARRHGVSFWRSRRTGLYQSTAVPLADILNLQPNFAEQISAGGIPVRYDEGRVRIALIKVTRKSGSTWEVAKGKLEAGEPPEHAAVREVREEMGLNVDLRITRQLGIIRYGFLAPGGLPRLKTIHLFLMEPQGEIESFTPAIAEGIGAVGWFTPEEAVRAVTHTSLIPLIQEVGALLGPRRPSPEEP